MIVDFLTADIPADDLAAALRVLRKFKDCESEDEWLRTMFVTWTKLEQLEEFLAHRVEGKDLANDTKAEIARHKSSALGDA